MVNYIIENYLSSSLPDIISACSIFLTIPITVRLNNISILNIERERTEELNID